MKKAPVKSKTAPASYPTLLAGIGSLLEQSRRSVARAANCFMTATYWEVGRRIVEFDQGGEKRAAYGEELLERLAEDLTARHGRGFGWRNLASMKLFFLSYPNILQTASAKLLSAGNRSILQTPPAKTEAIEISQTLSAKSSPDWLVLLQALSARFSLPWSPLLFRRRLARPLHARFAAEQSHGPRIPTRPPRREKARSRTRRRADAVGEGREKVAAA